MRREHIAGVAVTIRILVSVALRYALTHARRSPRRRVTNPDETEIAEAVHSEPTKPHPFPAEVPHPCYPRRWSHRRRTGMPTRSKCEARAGLPNHGEVAHQRQAREQNSGVCGAPMFCVGRTLCCRGAPGSRRHVTNLGMA